MERVTVYIDGFNFYYGLIRQMAVDGDWKNFYWIDIVKLFDHFVQKNQTLQKVYYFTTPPLNPQKSNRQTILFEANKLLNGDKFEVVKGKFYEKSVLCKNCKQITKVPEEKRTDVNISVQMMRDCAKNNTDLLILVSADSDLVPPLESIRQDHPEKKIKVYFPPKNHSYDLKGFMQENKGNVLRLEAHKIRFFNSRMPDAVTIGETSYTIPPEWKAVQTIPYTSLKSPSS